MRKRGFAINDQATETGLTAIGMVVRDPDATPAAAISLVLPRARFDRDLLPTWVGAMSACVTKIENALASVSGWAHDHPSHHR